MDACLTIVRGRKKISAPTSLALLSKDFVTHSLPIARIMADRDPLAGHYGNDRPPNTLPPWDPLASRRRDQVPGQFMHATRDCSKAYEKGKRACNTWGLLHPAVLEKCLPIFQPAKPLLDQKQ
jgi:hypothetical protein